MRSCLLLIPLGLAAAEPAPAPAPAADLPPGVVVEHPTPGATVYRITGRTSTVGVQIGSIASEESKDAKPAHDPTQPWQLGFTGLRFGGIIGAAAELGLRYDPGWQVQPELTAEAGISGTKVALGGRWLLRQRQWKLDAGGLKLDGDSSTAITPRAVALYRWEEEHRRPAFWRGMHVGEGWHLGGEVGVSLHGVALDAAVTWRRGSSQPSWTLAYGLAF